jgi:hypothetical protein
LGTIKALSRHRLYQGIGVRLYQGVGVRLYQGIGIRGLGLQGSTKFVSKIVDHLTHGILFFFVHKDSHARKRKLLMHGTSKVCSHQAYHSKQESKKRKTKVCFVATIFLCAPEV